EVVGNRYTLEFVFDIGIDGGSRRHLVEEAGGGVVALEGARVGPVDRFLGVLLEELAHLFVERHRHAEGPGLVLIDVEPDDGAHAAAGEQGRQSDDHHQTQGTLRTAGWGKCREGHRPLSAYSYPT